MKSFLPKIIIENGALKKLPQILKTLGKSFAVVTDVHLRSAADEIVAAIKTKGLKCSLLILPAGEKTKSMAFVEKIINSLLRLGVKRDSCLIAFGGGVLGDLVGFVASIYMRGVPFAIAPTTLLAMADSGIGGKTGIDTPEGKNLIGTFYHPKLVVMDPQILKTLSDRDFAVGLAEIVKHAVIANKAFFGFLEKNAGKILRRDGPTIKKMLAQSVKVKMAIVKRDEKESLDKLQFGKSRMLLNYGHTVGHALEKLSDYKLPHGHAVSIGMVAENRVAIGKKILQESQAGQIEKLLKTFGLPTKIPPQFESAEIKKALYADKKNIDGKLHFALPVKIGAAKIFAL